MPTKDSEAVGRKGNAKVIKSYRLPKELVDILESDAKEQNISSTDLLVSILKRYANFVRFADKFGMITVSKETYKKLFEGLADERVRELASEQSVLLSEYVSFWYKEQTVDTLLEALRTISHYQWVFDLSSLRKEHDLTIVLRTDLGKKFTLYIGTAYQKGIAKMLGVTPKTEIDENQVKFTLPV